MKEAIARDFNKQFYIYELKRSSGIIDPGNLKKFDLSTKPIKSEEDKNEKNKPLNKKLN